MRLLLYLLLLLSLLLPIDSRGGRGGGGRGRSSVGRSRAGGKWGYGQGKNVHGSYGGYQSGYHGGSGGGSGMGNRNRGGSSGSQQPYIRKTPSIMTKTGPGSFHTSKVAMTAIGLAALPLVTRVFGNNVIREKEKPLKVDGINYYWSAELVPEPSKSIVCAVYVDKNDTSFNNITFADLTKVTELAWSCANSTYCCGLSCCRDGYEGVPLGTIGYIGVGLVTMAALLIPVVSVQRLMSTNEAK